MIDAQSLARDLLASLANPLQDQRLIELDAPVDGLVVERFRGREELCGDYRFQLQCFISGSDRRDDGFLDALIGQPLTLSLRRADGGWRRWHGVCVDGHHFVDMDGLPRCELTVAPWTWWLEQRLNSLVFPQCTVREVLEQVFAEYPDGAVRFDLMDPLPRRPMITQYRESDWHFVRRLMAECALAWRFEHRQDEGEGNSGAPVTLVIFDRHARHPDAAPLHFHNDLSEEGRAAITRFTDGTRLTPNAVQVASWHSGKVRTVTGRAEEADPDGLPVREVYWHHQDARFDGADQAEQSARHHLDALRVLRRVHRGEGRSRTLAAGEAFTLSGHPRCDQGPYLALAVEHAAVNNLAHAGELLGDDTLKAGQYRNTFLAVPATTPVAPLYRPKPTVGGPLVARVVGMPGDAVTSNRDHQVRIQYAWQRGTAPNPGSLDDTGGQHPGHAPGDHSSGIWVPVAEALAGPNWGGNFLPRVDSEVLVEFRQGDIDQPVVIGQLYNGEVKPPFGVAREDGTNHAGTVSGLQTREHDGQGDHSPTLQRLLLDDTPKQVSVRLETSLARSGLGLGYLVDYSVTPGPTRRGALRGQGWELATQAWTTVRAGRGLLISASAKAKGQGTQMEMNEAVAQLKGAERTAQALHDAATAAGAPGLAGNAAQTAFREALDPQVDGRYTAPVAGQSPFKPRPGSREDSNQPVETFADPKLVLESPDHIVLNSDKSAAAMAGEHLHITTQSDGHISAGDNLALASGGSAGLYSHKGPLKIISENGPVSLQANGGPLELLADQAITASSSEGKVSVLAKEKITLQSGQTEIVLDGANITFRCPGTFTVKGSIKSLEGGQSGNTSLPALPAGLFSFAPLAKKVAGLAPSLTAKAPLAPQRLADVEWEDEEEETTEQEMMETLTLTILPVRHAVATGALAEHAPQLPKQLVPPTSLSQSRETLRLLRAGYLYVLLDRGGRKEWQHYQVKPNGDLTRFEGEAPKAPAQPEPVTPNTLAVEIEKAETVERSWWLFTPDPLTDARKADYEENADDYTAKGYWQTFSPKEWAEGQTSQLDTLHGEQIGNAVTEACLDGNPALQQALTQDPFAPAWLADDQGLIQYANVGVLKGTLTTVTQAVSTHGAVLALNDALGAAQTLNTWRNAALDPLHDWLQEEDEHGVSNDWKVQIQQQIEQLHEGYAGKKAAGTVQRESLRWEAGHGSVEHQLHRLEEEERQRRHVHGDRVFEEKYAAQFARRRERIKQGHQDTVDAARNAEYSPAQQNAYREEFEQDYLSRLNTGEMDQVQTAFLQHSAEAETEMNRRAPEQIAVLQSDYLQGALQAYDKADEENGARFTATLGLAVDGLVGCESGRSVIDGWWAQGPSGDPANLCWRAMAYNHQALEDNLIEMAKALEGQVDTEGEGPNWVAIGALQVVQSATQQFEKLDTAISSLEGSGVAVSGVLAWQAGLLRNLFGSGHPGKGESALYRLLGTASRAQLGRYAFDAELHKQLSRAAVHPVARTAPRLVEKLVRESEVVRQSATGAARNAQAGLDSFITQPKASEVRYGRALSVLIAAEVLMLAFKAESVGAKDQRFYMEAMAAVMAGAACGAEMMASAAESAAQRAAAVGNSAEGARILQGSRKLWAASMGTVGGVVLAAYDFGDFWGARKSGQGTLATAYLARGLAGLGLGLASSLLAIATAKPFFEHVAKTSTNRAAVVSAGFFADLSIKLGTKGAQQLLTRVLVGSNAVFWGATGVWYLMTPDALEAWCDKSVFRKNNGTGYDDLDTELSELWMSVAEVT
ncbi:T6SS effector BTH_I2691 family protein [Alloalcanivorax xenomutans]|uniref:T6SS effector BTH_I2691 family protein n=1 Tax=Alloalcanivorax xenomutans TaxID=1094342 RepID=UPI001AC00726|nr:T6SS effector BTH_I2691 family protein [Alloalcanivorax xenomutans]